MKTATFNYTDAKGKESHRELLVLQTPSDKYSGYDIAELSDINVGNFIRAYEELQELHKANIATLLQAYDMNYKYRTFFEKNMTDIFIDEI